MALVFYWNKSDMHLLGQASKRTRQENSIKHFTQSRYHRFSELFIEGACKLIWSWALPEGRSLKTYVSSSGKRELINSLPSGSKGEVGPCV